MKLEAHRRANDVRVRLIDGSAKRREPTQFWFGTRRYAKSGPRRLFVTQKYFLSPALAPESERSDAFLRVISTAA